MKPLFLTLMLAVLGTGCASQNYTAASVSRTAPLRRDAAVLVAMADDGQFGDDSYIGSGRAASQVVSAAFSRQLTRVELTPDTGSLAQHLARARGGRFDYLVIPRVLHPEDRGTEWSGQPDQIKIEIRTVDVSTGDTVAEGVVSGKGKWFTMGSDAPEDLLKVPVNAYVKWLFSPEGTPVPVLK